MKQLPTTKMIKSVARLRPGAELADPAAGGKHALRSLARRHAVLDEEIKELHQALTELTQQAAPNLLARPGVRVHVAATTGHGRRQSGTGGIETSFAHLTGVAPIPASSGQHHRLNRGGDRAANNALYTVALVRHEDTTSRRAPTSVPYRRRPVQGTSCAASNAPSPRRCTECSPRRPQSQHPRPTKPSTLLDIYRSILASFMSEHLERAEPDLLRSLWTIPATATGAGSGTTWPARWRSGSRSCGRAPTSPDWLLERRRRAEPALTTVVATCYLLGV